MPFATKLLLTILFAAFLQNGIEATKPMDALYREMFIELSKQSNSYNYEQARKEWGEQPWSPALSKPEMGIIIYRKIDLLEGILAELQAKRGQMQGEREYFPDENTVGMFLNFVKQKRGPGHRPVFFSNFPSEKYENGAFFHLVTDKKWIMDELLGRTYPNEFFKILDHILAIKHVQKEMHPESGIPATYHPFETELIKFIHKFKLEIVVGQTHNDFEDKLKKNIIQSDKEEIEKKIEEDSTGQNMLFEKYKHLNDASQELYNALEIQILQLMDNKAKKVEAKLSEETIRLAFQVKNAFAQVLPEMLVSTSSGMSAHSNITPMLEIQRDLCLPEHWLEEQKKFYWSWVPDKDGHLRSKIHMHTAMLLLAYERTAKFYD